MATPDRGSVRLPTPADADALAAVHVESWRESYGHLLPARFFDETALGRRVQMWNRTLGREVLGREIRVAEWDGDVVGFALSLPARAASAGVLPTSALPTCEDPPVHDAELTMIYLLGRVQGSGLGQLLLDGVLGNRSAMLWMAADNPRALAFYRRNRFEPTGARRVDEDLDDLAEIALARGSSDIGVQPAAEQDGQPPVVRPSPDTTTW